MTTGSPDSNAARRWVLAFTEARARVLGPQTIECPYSYKRRAL